MTDLWYMEPQLVRIIESGEMDPWNLDLKEISQSYIKQFKKKQDLRVSGNALIILALLLKMKSDVFEEKQEKPEEHMELKLEAPDIEIIPLSRRVERKVTVFELLDALRDAFELEKRKIESKTHSFELKFCMIDLSKIIERLLKNLHGEMIVDGIGSLSFLALLHLAMKGVIDIEQQSWNGPLVVKRLA
ncbi:MAG: segregation/condensation protein A [Candidatus Altiarchaeota archaeon]|nr:segregation/condensation protein A [Candidatus Altiarchaeota archaeon]